MKKYSKFLWVFLVFAMVLGACEVIETTPPVVEEPTAVVEPTLEETESTTSIEPTEPTEPLPIVDAEGKMVCTVEGPLFPELTAEQEAQIAVFPEVSDEDWSIGPEDAILTVVEYTDFFCPYCGSAFVEFENLLETHGDDVRLVYRALPLDSLHPTAPIAAYAAEAAGRQGKFWEMYRAIFNNQGNLAELTAEELTESLMTTAEEELELDMTQFVADFESDELRQKITDGQTAAFEAGISGTPTVLVNRRPISTSSIPYFGSFIDVMKAEEGLTYECPPFVIDQEKEYTATIETENGEMVLELYPKEAPLAVNSFVYLAREGFYDGVTFHRVFHDFMAQSGDPSGTGMGGAGYRYREEIVPELTYDEAYMLGVARTQEEGTSGSQFFITYIPVPELNEGYTIFGKLIDGFDVFEQITERDSDSDPNLPIGDKIIKITINEK